jgi:maltooligosyltrehalose synthase
MLCAPAPAFLYALNVKYCSPGSPVSILRTLNALLPTQLEALTGARGPERAAAIAAQAAAPTVVESSQREAELEQRVKTLEAENSKLTALLARKDYR